MRGESRGWKTLFCSVFNCKTKYHFPIFNCKITFGKMRTAVSNLRSINQILSSISPQAIVYHPPDHHPHSHPIRAQEIDHCNRTSGDWHIARCALSRLARWKGPELARRVAALAIQYHHDESAFTYIDDQIHEYYDGCYYHVFPSSWLLDF